MLKGFTRKFRPLEFLSEDEIEDIHRATLTVLRQTGVTFDSDWALDLLKKNGCQVDMQTKRVRFPEALVEECIRSSPSSIFLKARDPKYDVVLGGNTVYFIQAAGMQTIDIETLQPRPATRKEFADYVRLLDGLPNLHWLNSYPFYGFAGSPPVMAMVESVALKLKHSGKHMTEGHARDSELFTDRMVRLCGAEITGGAGCQAPLSWSEDSILRVRRSVEAGFPMGFSDGNAYGATAPATVAGSVVICSAELLSMVVLIQVLSPGHRMRVGHYAFPQDMRSGFPAFCDIGCSISNVVFNQVWRRYRIPVSNGSPGYPSSKSIDFQSAYEKAMAALLSALSGGSTIILHGGVNGELTAHGVQAVLDDDIAGMIGRVLEGATVDDEQLAVDLIDEVGPVPGHFLNKAHTRKWWKTMQYLPMAADRLPYPEWLKTGKKTARDYAKSKMQEIVATHKPEPLTADQERGIEEVLREAREHYRKAGLISDAEWSDYMRAIESPE